MTIHCWAVSNEPRIASSHNPGLPANRAVLGNPSGGPVTGTDTETRVGKAAAGTHAISGSRRDAKQDVATTDAMTFTYKTSGGDTPRRPLPRPVLHCETRRQGSSVRRRSRTTTVSLMRNRRLYRRNGPPRGKPISLSKMTVSADGKSMTTEVADKLHGTKSRYCASKQGKKARRRKEPTREAVDGGPSMNPSQRWEPSAAL
jgi:hypothetical protein